MRQEISGTDFLKLQGKSVLILGVSNRKSVGFHVAQVLREAGVQVLLVVHTEERKASLLKLTGDLPIFVCDVAKQEEIDQLAREIRSRGEQLAGIVHSIAFADYSAGWIPFHETPRAAFLNAIDVSCFSLIALSNALKEMIDPEHGSIVTISISTTRMAAENYGYMAPAKAALDSAVVFLAKSFSKFSKIRFNSVAPGLLKTSSSAGIPGYVASYLFAERATLRKEALKTEEVANTVAFLLSPRSSGINAQGIVIDAGMETNYFDAEFVSPPKDGG